MSTASYDLQPIQHKLDGIQDAINRKQAEFASRLLAMEQKFDANAIGGGFIGDSGESIGEQIVASDGFKALCDGRVKSTGSIRLQLKTALVSAIGQNQPLVPADRTGIISGPNRRLRVRDLLPNLRTSSSMVETVKESSFTNNAAPQYSAGQYENVAKAESALTFELSPTMVVTLAHWIPVSRQLLSDSPALQGFINSRLLYGLKLVEENELLNGTGIQGHLSGLVTNATAYDTSYYEATDTYLDTIRHSFTQLEAADFVPSGVVLNPKDFARIAGTKETGSGISSGMYLFGDPQAMPIPRLWGVPCVITNAMSEGQFLSGAFDVAAAIFDRMDAVAEISLEHDDYFVKNMAAILVEERLALATFRAAGLIYGAFPFGS